MMKKIMVMAILMMMTTTSQSEGEGGGKGRINIGRKRRRKTGEKKGRKDRVLNIIIYSVELHQSLLNCFLVIYQCT